MDAPTLQLHSAILAPSSTSRAQFDGTIACRCQRFVLRASEQLRCRRNSHLLQSATMLGAGRDSCQSLLRLLHQPLRIFNLLIFNLRIQMCDRSYRFYVAALSAWPGSVSTIPGLGIVCSALWVLAAGLSWVRCWAPNAPNALLPQHRRRRRLPLLGSCVSH